jgi:hypothetical protein
VNTSDPTEATLGAVSAIMFTAESWSIPQTVTITGVDDFVVDGGIASLAMLGILASDDTRYNGLDGNDVSVDTFDGMRLQDFEVAIAAFLSNDLLCGFQTTAQGFLSTRQQM